MGEKKVDSIIDIRLAKKMTTAYDTDVKAERSIRINKEDTKYVYIPTVELNAYLKKYPEAKGVRVYFGVINDYEIDGTTFNCNKEHKNQVTVILKATEKDSKKSHDTITPLIVLPKEKPLSGSDPLDEFGICPPPSTAGGRCNEIDEF